MDLEEVEKFNVKSEFSRERVDLHPWLKDNIKLLNRELNKNFSVLDRERKTPSGFSADLWVEDEDMGEGVIECQFKESDHNHLGKLITYLTAFDGDFGVWVVEEPRYEHEKAIDWLNETTEKSFFLVKSEIVKIGDSKGLNFAAKAEPGPDVKSIGDQKTKRSERENNQYKFWDQLLERSKEKGFTKFDPISPKYQAWISKRSPARKVDYQYIIRNNFARIRLRIGSDSQEKNEEIFDTLESKREEIENDFGEELEWNRMENSQLCKIRKRVSENGLANEDKWKETQEKMITSMEKFCETFDKHLREL